MAEGAVGSYTGLSSIDPFTVAVADELLLTFVFGFGLSAATIVSPRSRYWLRPSSELAKPRPRPSFPEQMRLWDYRDVLSAQSFGCRVSCGSHHVAWQNPLPLP